MQVEQFFRLMDLVVYELEKFLFPKYVAMAFSETLKWLKTKS